jgi:Domain of unknown function (DUF6438)
MRAALRPALFLLLAGCAPRKAVSPPAENASVSSGDTAAVITLERTACFGSCPVYRVAVSRTGAVSYEGKAHVRRVGAATDQIQAERVDALLSELDEAGYFSFADRYTPAEPTCGRYATDSPSAITTVRLSGRTKRIEHDYGCDAAPGVLVILERKIDELLNSAQWTGQ